MAQDFIYNENMDISIKNGDLEIGVSDIDHIQDVIQFNQGELKQYPLCGVGIDNYNQAPNVIQSLKRLINTQFEADNAIVEYLAVIFDTNDKAIVDINAKY